MIPTGATVAAGVPPLRLDGQSWDDGLVGTDLTAGVQRRRRAPQTVTVTFDEGFGYAQVFAPEGQDFICFEPMTAPTNALEDGRALTAGGARRGVPHRVQHRGVRQLRHRSLHVSSWSIPVDGH